MRKFPPLPPDHYLVTEPNLCPGCKQEFQAGDVVTLVPVGPGDSAEGRLAARLGKAFNAVAIPAHWSCVTGEE